MEQNYVEIIEEQAAYIKMLEEFIRAIEKDIGHIERQLCNQNLNQAIKIFSSKGTCSNYIAS